MNDDDTSTLDSLLEALDAHELAWFATHLELPAPEPTTRLKWAFEWEEEDDE